MKKKLFNTVLISCGLFLLVGERALAAPPAMSGSCGLDVYNTKIAEKQAEIEKLKQDVSNNSNVDSRRAVLLGDHSGSVVISEGALAAGASLMETAVAMGDQQQIASYRDVIRNLTEAEKSSPRDLEKLNDRNENLYYTTHVINKYYKATDPTFTAGDVAAAIKGAVRSGAFCREDGSLATGGDFRDLIVKERRKQLAAALEKATKSAEARRARAPAAPGSDHNSSKVDSVKPDSHQPGSPTNIKATVDADKGD